MEYPRVPDERRHSRFATGTLFNQEKMRYIIGLILADQFCDREDVPARNHLGFFHITRTVNHFTYRLLVACWHSRALGRSDAKLRGR